MSASMREDKAARSQSLDAQRRAEGASADLALLRRQVAELESVVEAMWFLLRQLAPQTPEHAKLADEVERRLASYAEIADRRAGVCKECGRKVSLLAGRCLYCSPDVS